MEDSFTFMQDEEEEVEFDSAQQASSTQTSKSSSEYRELDSTVESQLDDQVARDLAEEARRAQRSQKEFKKFESLSKNVLIEIAMSQEAMMKRLQEKLRKGREEASRSRDQFTELAQRTEAKDVLIHELEISVSTLKSKLEQAERRILVLKSECQDKELVKAAEEVIQTAEEGVQCEIPRTSLEWKPNNIANSNMLRVNSDAPSSLDSPVIQHLLDCWASAAGNFSSEGDGSPWSEKEKEGAKGSKKNGSKDDVEDKRNGFSLGSTGASHGELVGPRLEIEAKKRLTEWLSTIVESKDDEALVRVAEINNLPKEILDGFSIHLVPLLYGSQQFKVKTFMRSRDVYDMKLFAEPRDSANDLPDTWVKPNFTPNEKCVMCRELYFFPLRKDIQILDEWHSFNTVHTYMYCVHCAKLLSKSVNKRAEIYHKHLNGISTFADDNTTTVDPSDVSTTGESSTGGAIKVTKQKKSKKSRTKHRVARIE